MIITSKWIANEPKLYTKELKYQKEQNEPHEYSQIDLYNLEDVAQMEELSHQLYNLWL